MNLFYLRLFLHQNDANSHFPIEQVQGAFVRRIEDPYYSIRHFTHREYDKHAEFGRIA